MKKAVLLLEDGTQFDGESCGAEGEVIGEVVFNTSVVGYQEILTNPSYRGQIINMAYPEVGGYGVNNHEEIGAEFIKKYGFSGTVVELIRAHINAKRYLIFKDLAYYDKLTFASQQTFIYQGKPMSPEEAYAFEQDPLFQKKVLLRSCEELAKEPNCTVPGLETYYQMAIDHLYNQLLQAQN